MKFHDHHRLELLKSFGTNGFNKSQFSFIKRKGRIITQHIDTKNSFSYIARIETTINEKSREWIEISFFEIKEGNEPIKRVENWETLMHHFDQWIKRIKE